MQFTSTSELEDSTVPYFISLSYANLIEIFVPVQVT